MTSRVQIREAFKVALSMTLTYWLVLYMNWDMPQYAGLVILLISKDTTGVSLQTGVFRVVGAMAGLTAALVILAAFPQDRWSMMIAQAAWIMGIGYFMQGSRDQYAWFTAGMMPSLAWATAYGSSTEGYTAFHYALFRCLELTTGIVIYSAISALLWPRSAGEKLNQKGSELWDGLRELYELGRRQLTDEKQPDEAPGLRAGSAGKVSAMLATLDTAYFDTPSVSEHRKIWEVMRVNSRALVNAVALWQESIEDCRQLDLHSLLPELESDLNVLDKRFRRFGDVWKSAIWALDVSESDADRLKRLDLELDESVQNRLSRSQRSALLNFREQLRLVDLTSRELTRCLRVLTGLDSSRGFHVEDWQRELYRPVAWQPERLMNTLFPALSFIVAYLFWIYTNPPAFPVFLAPFSLLLLPAAGYMRFMSVIVVSIFSLGVPLVVFLMPAMDSGSSLLVMIFCLTFFAGWIGRKNPALRFGLLFVFTIFVPISNLDQTYSFVALMDSAVTVTVSFGILALVRTLLDQSAPELALRRATRRFFHGCSQVVSGFALYRAREQRRGHRQRRRALELMVLPASYELFPVVKHLNYKSFPANNPESVNRLLNSIEEIILRLESVELAYLRTVKHMADVQEPLRLLGDRMWAQLPQVFDGWAELKSVTLMAERRAALKEISRDIEQWLETREESGAISLSDHSLRDLYALRGSVRGLVAAMEECEKANLQINWDQFAEARF